MTIPGACVLIFQGFSAFAESFVIGFFLRFEAVACFHLKS